MACRFATLLCMVVLILVAMVPVSFSGSAGAVEGWSLSLVEANDSPATLFGTTSVVLDSEGAPHICYRICGEGSSVWYSVKHARLQSESWDVSRIDGGGNAFTPLPTSIAFDTDGTIHVGYSNITFGEGCVKYSNDSDENWAITDVSEGRGIGTMCLDSRGVAHMCYAVQLGLWDVLTCADNSGEGWASEIVDGLNHTVYASMAIDGNDDLHVAYTTSIVGYSILYATNAGGTWTTSVVDEYGRYGAIALDSTDSPRIVYVGRDSGQDSLKCARLAGESWINCTIAAEEGLDLYPSITVDGLDRSNVAYSVSTSTSSTLFHAVGADDDWTMSVVECFESDYLPRLVHSFIVVGSSGDVHISYMRGESSGHDDGGGLKYATLVTQEIPEMSSVGLLLTVTAMAAVVIVFNRVRF